MALDSGRVYDMRWPTSSWTPRGDRTSPRRPTNRGLSPFGAPRLSSQARNARRLRPPIGTIRSLAPLATTRQRPSTRSIVGSLPTSDGMAATARAGCLIILDAWGRVAETIQGGSIDGPWDMTAADDGFIAQLFVTNVLHGTVAAGRPIPLGAEVDRRAHRSPVVGGAPRRAERAVVYADVIPIHHWR